MPVDQYALVTSGNIREVLGFSSTETTDDEFICNIINRISVRMETYCNRQFKVREYTEYHDGDGTPEVFLDQFPIQSVSGLWDDPDVAYTSAYEITSGDYHVYTEEGMLRLFNEESTFSTSHKNIKIIYSGGYESVPNDVQDACINWVLREYRRAKQKSHSLSSRSDGGGSISYDLSAVPEDVKMILDMYKKRRL